MHTIPTFITSLSILQNNVVVQLNVQCLNEIFWGTMVEQHLILQQFSLLLPKCAQPNDAEPLPVAGDIEEEMPAVF